MSQKEPTPSKKKLQSSPSRIKTKRIYSNENAPSEIRRNSASIIKSQRREILKEGSGTVSATASAYKTIPHNDAVQLPNPTVSKNKSNNMKKHPNPELLIFQELTKHINSLMREVKVKDSCTCTRTDNPIESNDKSEKADSIVSSKSSFLEEKSYKSTEEFTISKKIETKEQVETIPAERIDDSKSEIALETKQKAISLQDHNSITIKESFGIVNAEPDIEIEISDTENVTKIEIPKEKSSANCSEFVTKTYDNAKQYDDNSDENLIHPVLTIVSKLTRILEKLETILSEDNKQYKEMRKAIFNISQPQLGMSDI